MSDAFFKPIPDQFDNRCQCMSYTAQLRNKWKLHAQHWVEILTGNKICNTNYFLNFLTEHSYFLRLFCGSFPKAFLNTKLNETRYVLYVQSSSYMNLNLCNDSIFEFKNSEYSVIFEKLLDLLRFIWRFFNWVHLWFCKDWDPGVPDFWIPDQF